MNLGAGEGAEGAGGAPRANPSSSGLGWGGLHRVAPGPRKPPLSPLSLLLAPVTVQGRSVVLLVER